MDTRTDYIFEVIRFRIRVQEFFKGLFNIATGIFHNLAHMSEQANQIFMEISSQM